MQKKAEIKAVEGTFTVPSSWAWCELKETVQAVFDGPFGSHLKTSDYTESGIRVIRLENLGYLAFKADKKTYISEDKYESLKQHTIYEGDIIVGSFIADGVKAALIPHLEETAIAKADCFCVRHNPERVDNRYLYYLLSTGFISDEYTRIMRGVTRSRINTTQLKQTVIPLAPLPEQRRIVAKLEELFSRLDAGVATLRQTQAQLKRYRQSLLHAAVTGELTRAWREHKVTQGYSKEELTWKTTTIGEVTINLDSKRKPVSKKIREKSDGKYPYYGANGQTGWIDDFLFDEELVLVVEDETFIGRTKPFCYKITGKTWVNNHAHVLKAKPELVVLPQSWTV